jgi:hypothetical protein
MVSELTTGVLAAMAWLNRNRHPHVDCGVHRERPGVSDCCGKGCAWVSDGQSEALTPPATNRLHRARHV